MTYKIKLILLAAIICLVGILIYSNTFSSSFHFDDKFAIENNPAIRDIWDPAAIWNFATVRFVGFLTFALNYHFNGLDVFGYHLINLLIHIALSMAVFVLIMLTFSTPALKNSKVSENVLLVSFLGSLVFLTHPLQTETVTYIHQRLTLLSTFFYIISLNLYIKSRLLQERAKSSEESSIYYALSLITALLGMFTKEIVGTLPLLILVYEFFFFRTKDRFEWKRTVPFFIFPAITLSILFITRPVWYADVKRLAVDPLGMSLTTFFTQLHVRVTYLRLFLIPINQNVIYDYPIQKTLFEAPVLASLCLHLLILYSAILAFRKYRLFSFGIFWIYLTLLPESSIVPLNDVIIEHRIYLPMVGYSFFLVAILHYFLREKRRVFGIALLIAVIVVCSFLSHARNRVWKDELTLWSDVISKSPGVIGPYISRSNYYWQNGEYDKAICDCDRALEIDPLSASLYLNRGNIYLSKSEYEKAVADYNKALAIMPDNMLVYSNRAIAYRRNGNYDSAISDYTEILRRSPLDADNYLNRAIAYAYKGDRHKAYSDIQKIYRMGYKIDPEIISSIVRILEKKIKHRSRS